MCSSNGVDAKLEKEGEEGYQDPLYLIELEIMQNLSLNLMMVQYRHVWKLTCYLLVRIASNQFQLNPVPGRQVGL